MGANTPKSIQDRAYRALAARYLREIQDAHDLNKGKLASALGVDRSVASRYLGGTVRPPLQRLLHLERSLNVTVPEEIREAFWLSEPSSPQPAGPPVDIENAIRDIGDQLLKASDGNAKAAARRELEELLRKLA